MTNKEIFKIWAPVGKRWVDWVRPVPFISIDENTKPSQPSNSLVLPCLAELNKDDTKTAIIIDMDGIRSVEAGILLAQQYGYRPIPVYNGVMEQKGARATSDNHSILGGLVWGASILSHIDLEDNAPPAFLVDSNRLNCFRLDGSIFDNSWDVYYQDLPSEKYLLEHGIERVLVISRKLAWDLKDVFANYPKKKIEVYWTNGYDEPKRVKKGRVRKNERMPHD